MTLNVRKLSVTPIRQNCMIMSTSDGKGVVIDPGGESERILSSIQDLTIEAILLTHGHLDHAGGAADLKAALSRLQGSVVPVWGPTYEDRFLLHSIENQAAAFGLTGMKSVEPDRYLEDGERLELLDREIEVRHLPGHTPGHVVFINHVEEWAFVGDTLFRGTIGRTDFAYGNTAALISGIRIKLLSLSDSMVVFPGHGLPTTIGDERHHNPML